MRHVEVVLLVVLFLGLAACDLIGASGNGGDYPTTLTPLSPDEIAKRTEAFHQQSDGHICSGLDSFGLASGDGCLRPDETPDETIGRKAAVTLAKQEVAAYQAYTNVESASALSVKNARPLRDSLIWRVSFRDQVYEGKRVRKTGILLWLTADGVFRIDQHWYRGIVSPEDPISREEALEQAVGHKINYSDWTGSQTLRVSKENLPPPDSVEMSVLPHRVEDELQLRVVWEFELADSFFRLYVDGARGSVVESDQLVVF
jgi:hypothetical protein